MNRKDLYPYKNRLFGTEELIYEKPDKQLPDNLATITLVNLKADDHFDLNDTKFTVAGITADSIIMSYGTQPNMQTEVITKANHTTCITHQHLSKAIGKDINARVESIEHIIERDPALFRARIGGWILIDGLVSMSGNVYYPSSAELREKAKRKAEQENAESDETAIKEVKSVSGALDQQMGFAF